MPEQEQPSTSSSGGGNSQERNRDQGGRSGDSRNRDKRNRGGPSAGPKFKGACEAIAEHVYDIGPYNQNTLFARTTESIAEHAARTFIKAGDLRNALINQERPDYPPPEAPKKDKTGNYDILELEQFRNNVKLVQAKKAALDDNLKSAFSLILGQCSRAVRDRLKSEREWKAIDEDSDPIRLLKLIQKSLYTQQTTKEPTHAFMDAENAFMAF